MLVFILFSIISVRTPRRNYSDRPQLYLSEYTFFLLLSNSSKFHKNVKQLLYQHFGVQATTFLSETVSVIEQK